MSSTSTRASRLTTLQVVTRSPPHAQPAPHPSPLRAQGTSFVKGRLISSFWKNSFANLRPCCLELVALMPDRQVIARRLPSCCHTTARSSPGAVPLSNPFRVFPHRFRQRAVAPRVPGDIERAVDNQRLAPSTIIFSPVSWELPGRFLALRIPGTLSGAEFEG